MDAALKPLQSNVAIAGPAVTVQCLGRDSAVCYKAIDLLRPGDVLVIDRSGDRRYACWGFEGEEAADARFRDDLVGGNSASDVPDIDALIAANSNH